MSFKFLPDIAIADIAFEVTAPTLDKLFEETAMACSDIMVDPTTVKSKVRKTIKLKSDSLDNLLLDFLNELVFLKDTKGLLFNKYSVKVSEKLFSLTAIATGEKIDRKNHNLRNDLKAITMHMFILEKRGKQWYNRIIVDI
ncbi:MAG TPA: archease [archaeon]|nr:archease [archaeon]